MALTFSRMAMFIATTYHRGAVAVDRSSLEVPTPKLGDEPISMTKA